MVTVGDAETVVPVERVTPAVQEYDAAVPLAVKVAGSPEQITTDVTVTVGTASIVIVVVAVDEGQPEAVTVFVTVYVPGVLPAKSTCPVVALTNTNPAVDVKVPALPPPLNAGDGFGSFWQ